MAATFVSTETRRSWSPSRANRSGRGSSALWRGSCGNASS
ncbi:hypothetical protein GBAR_LOCUS8958 [Geodia barretti]|uniref:Uncharacterized protein n=1 Tax=Geodia barretti TaxID=519541 RepID=A0AA35RMN9_GEOBA|nr:hypothetical protein GBAR_LOCUS8958 [Geodia barretti]